MCVVSIAWSAHPKWHLVVAGNRDEYHARQSASLSRWDDVAGVIAGRDLVSGGTWMGISERGRFAVVTNIRDSRGPDATKLSRGALVSDWLVAGAVPHELEAFNPFNLIVLDADGLQYLTNRPQPDRNPLAADIHGMSNAIAGEHWPRKDRLNLRVNQWLKEGANNPAVLLTVLADDSVPDDEEHPIFIKNHVYGTRSSTVIAIEHGGAGRIIERRFDAKGQPSGESMFDFDWSSCI